MQIFAIEIQKLCKSLYTSANIFCKSYLTRTRTKAISRLAVFDAVYSMFSLVLKLIGGIYYGL